MRTGRAAHQLRGARELAPPPQRPSLVDRKRFVEPSTLDVCGHVVRILARRVRALAAAVREEEALREAHALQQVERRLMFLLRLPAKPDNYIARERRARKHLPRALDERVVRVARVATPHAREHCGAATLCGHVQVIADVGMRRDGVEAVATKVLRVR